MAIKPITNKDAPNASAVNRESQTSIRSEKGNSKVVIKKPGGQNAGKGFSIGLKEIDTFEKLQELVRRVEKNPSLKIALLDYVKHFNQHFAILPDEPIYRDGIREYKDKYVSEEPFVWGTCTGAEHDCDDPFCTINT